MYGYVSLLDNVTVFRNPMPPATGRQKAYLLFRYEENGVCGYRQYEDSYDFPVKTTNTVLYDLTLPAATPTVDKRFDACEQVRVVKIDGNSFRIKTTNGRVTVEGTWQTFGKCSTCPEAAEKALQAALQKARDRNGGSITETTLIVEGITKPYGSAGEITYQNMNLMDILKNLSKTYNSLLDKAKVPEEVWLPGKEFFVRDGTGVISGAIDGAANEFTDKAQLVRLGLQLVSDPAKTATDLANFAQTMDWNKAQSVAIALGEGLVNYDAAEFDKGGIYAWHATGKVGGSLALNGAALLAIVADVPNTLKKAGDILKDWVIDLSKVKKISGRFPINSQMYAGKNYSFDINTNPPLQAKYNSNVPTAIKARLDALHAKYPNGVDFDEFGFARFEPYTVKVMKNGVEVEVKVTVQTAGNRNADFAAADAEMGIDFRYREQNKLTWHHVEDTKTMILVPFDIHDQVKHTGGIGVYKNDINYKD